MGIPPIFPGKKTGVFPVFPEKKWGFPPFFQEKKWGFSPIFPEKKGGFTPFPQLEKWGFLLGVLSGLHDERVAEESACGARRKKECELASACQRPHTSFCCRELRTHPAFSSIFAIQFLPVTVLEHRGLCAPSIEVSILQSFYQLLFWSIEVSMLRA
jgi:hypothetical protein